MESVACGCQQFPDVPQAPVDCLGADAEQGGDGDLGQAVPAMEDGGQEPVGECEDRAAPGAPVALGAWAVAASFVQVRLALSFVEGGQRGDG